MSEAPGLEDLETPAEDSSSLQQEILQGQPQRTAAALSDESRKAIRRMTEIIGTAREEGQSTANILQSIERDLGTGRGGLEGLLASMRENTEVTQQRYYLAGQENQLTKGADISVVRATWNSVGIKTCAECLARHGLTKTLEEWNQIGRPGQGSTRCRHRCRCTLLAVKDAQKLYGAKSEAALESQAREPIRQRAAAIAKETRVRGRDIQKSTFVQKLGDFRQSTATQTISAETAPS